VAGAKDYSGESRPAVILQDDRFDAAESITICVVITDPAEAPLFSRSGYAYERNGLNALSCLMVDKIATVPKISSDTASGISMPKICSASIKPS
jgi:mRNA interferase MazF